MAKLLVRYGKSKKNLPFHPELRLRDTAYSRGHWQEMHFRQGCFCGAKTIREHSLEQAIVAYLDELRRMEYTQVSS